MAYGGPEYWYVVYKAVGDFGDLIADAAKAKAALKALQDQANSEATTEAAGVDKVVLARQKEMALLKEESATYDSLAQSAQRAAVWTEFGGRQSMEQHLSDLAQETNWLTLINRQKWLGFTSPQAAYAWRQLELEQAWLMNRAKFGATSSGTGYTTPDQYLSYLQKEYAADSALNTVMKERSGIYYNLANAYLAYANALRGTHETLGAIGEAAPGASSAIATYESALVGVPAEITTTMNVDDSAAIAKLAAYRTLLKGIGGQESVSVDEVIRAATGLGGVAIPSALPPEQIAVSYVGPYAEQFNRILAEVTTLSRLKADIPVDFHLDPANVDEVVSALKTDFETTKFPVLVSQGGGAGGGGGPPPVAPGAADEPDPAKVSASAAAENTLADAEKNVGDEATLAAAKLAVLQAMQSGDAKSASALAYAYNSLADSSKSAGDDAVLLTPKLADTGAAAAAAGGFVGFLQRQLTLFGGAFGTTAIIGSISVLVLGLHILLETLLVLVPALGALVAGFAAIGIWGVAAADAATRVYNQFTALNDVSAAFGQNLPPITNELHNLEAEARPQVFELLGLALNEAGKQGNIFSEIVNKVGNDLVDFAIKVVDWFNNKGRSAIDNFLKVGGADLSAFGNILLNLGRAFEPLLKAGEITKVAETLLQGLAVAIGYVAEAMKVVPTWALVFLIAGHSIITYGGLAVTVLQSVARSILGVTANIPGLQRVSASLSETLGATAGELAAMGANTPQLEQLALAIRNGDQSAIGMAKDLGLTADQLTMVVAKDPEIKQVAESFGLTAEQVAATQIQLTNAGKSAEEWAQSSSNATNDVKAGLNDIKTASGDAAAEMASLGVIAAKSGSEAETGIANYAAAAAKADESTVAVAGDASLLSKAFTGVEAAVSGVVGWLAANWILVAAAAAAAALYLNYAFGQVTQGTKNYLATAKSALANDTLTQGLQDAAQQLGQMTQQIDSLGKQVQSAGGFWQQFIANFKAGGNTFSFIMKSLNISQAANSIHALSVQQEQDLHDVGNAATTVSYLMSHFGLTSQQALGLMDVAGVKLSDSLTVMEQKVQDLIAGWNMMAIKGGVLYNSVNAVTFATDQQASSISKITGGWDAFFQLVEAAPAGFLTFQQDLQAMATNANAAGANFTGLSANSLTLQQSFLTAASGGQQLLDQLMNQVSVGMQGVAGTNLLTQATKDMAAQLLPAASHSQTLTTVLYALAQQGGYQGADSFKALSQWVETGSSSMQKAGGPAQQLQKFIDQAAGSVGNLATDVKNLDDAVNTQLVQVMTNAKLALAPGLTGALESVGKDVQGVQATLAGGFNFPPTLLSDSSKLASTLISIIGNKQQAEAYFETWVTNMGLTKAQAQALWDDVTGAQKATDTASQSAAGWHGHMMLVGGDAGTAAANTAMAASNTDKARASADTLKGTWDNILGDLAQFGTRWLDNFKTAVDSIHGWIDDIGSWFASLFSSTGGGSAGSAISSGIKGAFQAGLGLAEDVVKGSITILLNIFDLFLNLLEGHWSAAWQNIVNIGEAAWKDFIDPLWNVFNQGAVVPIGKFFTSTFPNYFISVGQSWLAAWKTDWNVFNTNIVQPVGNFFVKTIPGWFTSVGQQWLTNWRNSWNAFNTNIVQPFTNFFGKTIPSWFNSFTSGARLAWDTTWNAFNTTVVGGFTRFFTVTIPHWWTDMENGGKAAIQGVANSIGGAFKAGLNDAIGLVNDVIHGINAVTHIVGIPAIPNIPTLAGGGTANSRQAQMGSVSGSGSEDSQLAMLTPGEWVLRAPARSALEAKYGPGVMSDLNYADRWLGSGSRGPEAGQHGPGSGWNSGGGIRGYQGGGIIGDITHFIEGAASSVVHLGSIVVDLAKETLEAGFNAFWDATIAPLISPLANDAAPGKILAMGPDELKIGIDNLLSSASQKAASATAGPGGSSATGVIPVARYILSHGGTKEAAAGVGGVVAGESGGNPEAIEYPNDPMAGGEGILQWTPPTSARPYYPIITGNAGKDMATQLPDMIEYINSRGGMAALNAAGATGGPLGAASRFSQMEAPAVAGSDIRVDIVNMLYAMGLAGGGLVSSSIQALDTAIAAVPADQKKVTVAEAAEAVAKAKWQTAEALLAADQKNKASKTAIAAAQALVNSTKVAYNRASALVLQDKADLVREQAVLAHDESSWTYAAPPSLRAYDVTDEGYRLMWEGVTPPTNHPDPSYTVETFQLDGKLVDKFQTQLGSSNTAEYGYGGKGLHPAWSYRTWVWANGAPVAPPHSQVIVPLLKHTTSGPGSFQAGASGTGTSTSTSTTTTTSNPGLNFPQTPGPGISPVPTILPGAASINLMPVATAGGPGVPVIAGPGGAAMGFASGGSFSPGGAAAAAGYMASGGMPDLGAMFGFMMPGNMLPNLPSGLLRQMQTVQGQGGTSRRMSDAARASSPVIAGDFVINNPQPEPPSQSIAQATNKLSFLAGRQS